MYFKSKDSLRLLPLLLCASLSVFAQEGQSIGKVLSVNGAVTARDANGVERNLARRADIHVHDTILIGADGFAQIRMADSALISFKANTEFAFNAYSFDGKPETPDSALMSMAKGGFRAISGSVGHGKGDDYRIDTPFASIGIRGTTHEALLDGGVLYTGVYEGGTTISNNQGSVDTGINANYDFTQTTQGQPPKGLLEQPPVLANLQVNVALEADKADKDAKTTADASGNAKPAADTGSSATTAANNAPAAADASAAATTTGTTASSTASSTGSSPATSSDDSRRLTAVIDNVSAGSNSSSSPTTPPPTTPGPSSSNNVASIVDTSSNLTARTTSSTPANTATTIVIVEATINPALFVRTAEDLGGSGATKSTTAASSSTNIATTVTSDRATTGTTGNTTTVASTTTGTSSTTTVARTATDNSSTSSATTAVTSGRTTTDTSGSGNVAASVVTSASTVATTTDSGRNTGSVDGATSNSTSSNSGKGNGSSSDTATSSTVVSTGSGRGNSDDSSSGSTSNGKSTTTTGTVATTTTVTTKGNDNSDGKESVSSGNGNSTSSNSGKGNSSNSDTTTSNTVVSAGSGRGNSDDSSSGSTSNGKSTITTGTVATTTTTTTNGKGNDKSNGNESGNSGNGNSSGSSGSGSSVVTTATTTTNPQSLSYWDTNVLGSLQGALGEAATRSYLGSISLPYSRAVEIAGRSGSVNYSSGSFGGSDERGVALKDVEMSFVLDLAGRTISSGRLVVEDASDIKWTATFSGTAGGTGAGMSGIEGKLSGGDRRISSGSISGVFVGSSAHPDFLSAFKLQSAADSVQGVVGLSQ